MAYTIKFTSQKKLPFIIEDYRYDGAGSPTGQHTSLKLFGKGSSDYGESLWTNLVRMLENHCNYQAPDAPTVGQLWFNSSGSGSINVCKPIQNGSKINNWIPLIDKQTLKELLSNPNFLETGALPHYVKLARNGTNLNGDLEISGNVRVSGHLYAMRTPTVENEVLTLGYFTKYINENIGDSFVKLKSETQQDIDSIILFKKGVMIDAKLSKTEDTTVSNIIDLYEDWDFVTKNYVDKKITSSGLDWPTKFKDTVLVTDTDGVNVSFSKIMPSHICYKVDNTKTEKTDDYVLTSDNTEVRWKPTGDTFVTVNGNNQKINGTKVLMAAIKLGDDAEAAAGKVGQVLTSNGPTAPPTWGEGGGGGSSIPPGILGQIYAATGNDNPSGEWKNIGDLIKQFGNLECKFETVTTKIHNTLQNPFTGYEWVGVEGQILEPVSKDVTKWGQFDCNSTLNTTSNYNKQLPIFKSYNRGYIKLPDNIMIQWITGPELSFRDNITIEILKNMNAEIAVHKSVRHTSIDIPFTQYKTKINELVNDTSDCCIIPGAGGRSVIMKTKFMTPFKSVLITHTSCDYATMGLFGTAAMHKDNQLADEFLFGIVTNAKSIQQLTNSNYHVGYIQTIGVVGTAKDIPLSMNTIAIGTY